MEERVQELRKLSREKIALKLKAFRKQHGYTQEEFARRVHIVRANVARWENEKVRISTNMLRMLVAEGIL